MSLTRNVFLFVFVIFYSTFACVYDAADDRVLCTSFEALHLTRQLPILSRLYLINDGTNPLLPVKKGTFQFHPNVTDLRVNGLANRIEKGAFNGLINLYELHLYNNILHVLPPEIFENLTVAVIYIFKCDVREIQPKVFDNLPNLKQVYLQENKFSTIEKGVFTGTKLSYLDLRKNGITHIQTDAFGNMENLKFLNLEENQLTTFRPQFFMGVASKLTHLYLDRNNLKTATRAMFIVIPNLQILLLNMNKIEKFGDNTFTDLKQLQLLDVSHNHLNEFQSNVFNAAGESNLQLLYLHGNRLSFLSSGVLVRLPKLQKISVGGNPWQCSCWNMIEKFMHRNNITNLCYEEYTKGQRPFCVSSDRYPNDCMLDLDKVGDMPQMYADAMKEYEKLPSLCKVDDLAKVVLED